MLSLLHYAISIPSTLPPFPTAWGAPPQDTVRPRDATFATLWSDVGPEFYRKVLVGQGDGARDGWVMQWDAQVKWNVEPSDAAEELPKGWRALDEVTDIPADVLPQQSSRYLETATKRLPADSTLAYDAPTSPGITHWISRFKRFYPAHLSAPGQVHHAYLHESTHPPSVITLVPVFDPTEDAATLIVSFLGIPSSDSAIAESTYDLITRQAARYGCAQVEVWEVPEDVVKVWQARSGGKVKRAKRKEHLGAMVWYGEEPVERVRAVGGE